MAKTINFSSEIQPNEIVKSVHVRQFVNSFTAVEAYNISISGSLDIEGPTTISSGSLRVNSNIVAPNTTINPTTPDKFLILDTSGVVKYRSLTQMKNDIGGGLDILNNTGSYIITATGNTGSIEAQPLFVFTGSMLGVNTQKPSASIDVQSTGSEDILLVRNSSSLQGITVNNEGVLQLSDFTSLPTPITGGVVYSNDDFYLGFL